MVENTTIKTTAKNIFETFFYYLDPDLPHLNYLQEKINKNN